MEAQRERSTQESNTQQQQQQLPPPPEAFPLTEYSQIQSQLPSEAVQPSTNPSPSNPFTNNPFGDSNAVSARGSLSASVSVPPPNLFSDIANALQRSIRQVDEQSLRDDAESLAPPPEYQEHQYQETFVPTGIGLEAGLPSYDAAESRDLGAEKDEVETDIEQDARLQGRTLQSTATGTDEKSDLKKAEQHQRTLHHPHIDESLPTHPREMEEKKHIELLAITEAISRAYASSPQLEAQRYKTPPSRQESAFSSSVGAASDLRGSGEASGSLSLSDTASLLAHSGRKAGAGKGKERASGSSLGSEVVMVGGRKMTKEDEAELKKIWDQIERAHGYRLGEQSHVVNPASETERQGRQKDAFYHELLRKTGEGRLRSQDHSPPSGTSNRVYNQTQGSNESFPVLYAPAPASASAIAWNQSFAPIHTPESQRSSPGIFNMLRTDGRQSGEGPNLLPSGERKPSAEEMLSMQDFLEKEERLVTIQEFLKKELGEGK